MGNGFVQLYLHAIQHFLFTLLWLRLYHLKPINYNCGNFKTVQNAPSIHSLLIIVYLLIFLIVLVNLLCKAFLLLILEINFHVRKGKNYFLHVAGVESELVSFTFCFFIKRIKNGTEKSKVTLDFCSNKRFVKCGDICAVFKSKLSFSNPLNNFTCSFGRKKNFEHENRTKRRTDSDHLPFPTKWKDEKLSNETNGIVRKGNSKLTNLTSECLDNDNLCAEVINSLCNDDLPINRDSISKKCCLSAPEYADPGVCLCTNSVERCLSDSCDRNTDRKLITHEINQSSKLISSQEVDAVTLTTSSEIVPSTKDAHYCIPEKISTLHERYTMVPNDFWSHHGSIEGKLNRNNHIHSSSLPKIGFLKIRREDDLNERFRFSKGGQKIKDQTYDNISIQNGKGLNSRPISLQNTSEMNKGVTLCDVKSQEMKDVKPDTRYARNGLGINQNSRGVPGIKMKYKYLHNDRNIVRCPEVCNNKSSKLQNGQISGFQVETKYLTNGRTILRNRNRNISETIRTKSVRPDMFTRNVSQRPKSFASQEKSARVSLRKEQFNSDDDSDSNNDDRFDDFYDIANREITDNTSNSTLNGSFSSETVSRLAKRMSRNVESMRYRYEETNDTIKIVQTENEQIQHEKKCSRSGHKKIKCSTFKRDAWLLEKFLQDELHRPSKCHDYRSFSREWHRSSIPQRRFHVCMLLTMQERLETFKFWPADFPISKIDLVEAGFVYKGDGYEVQCITCGLVKSDWSEQDIPLEVHKRLRPECEYLKTTFPDLNFISGNTVDSPFQIGNEQSLVSQIGAMSINSSSFQQNADAALNNSHSVSENIPQQPQNLYRNQLSYGSGNVVQQSQNSQRIQTPFLAAPQQQLQWDNPIPESPMNTNTSIPSGAEAFPCHVIDGVSPKHPEYSTIQDRLVSFRSWSYSHLQDPVYLVDAGFYSVCREDIVRCFFCDIGLAEWDSEDDPWVEHARHSPDCKYLIKERGEEFIESIQSSWRQIYSPRHPEYADYHVRIQTFNNWPSDLDQRPHILSEAGFFYTGEEDVVRCHYCDGGLRQWEPGDDPWTEHARWFPFCKYIVKIKGLAFIEDVARRYNEEYLTSPTDTTNPETIIEGQPRTNDHFRSPLSAEIVERITELGYDRRQINRAFQYHVQTTGRRHASADELTNILLENDISLGQEVNNRPSTAAKEIIKKTASEIDNLEPQQLIDMNTRLKQQLMCQTCNQKESCMVFGPCGHRVVCEECSKSYQVCPSCGQAIQHKIKTYLA